MFVNKRNFCTKIKLIFQRKETPLFGNNSITATLYFEKKRYFKGMLFLMFPIFADWVLDDSRSFYEETRKPKSPRISTDL